MNAIAASARRIPAIDVLRGIAVLLVTLHHTHLRFLIEKHDVATLLPRSIGNPLFWSGHYSVIVFFVISGFLITSLSLQRWGAPSLIPLGGFYRLRAARLLPCLLLLLAVLSAAHVANVPGFTIPPERASLSRALVAGLGFHVNWLEGHHGYLPANWDILWSLSVEETFYLLFPLACFALRRDRWLFVLLLALIVVGPFNRVALRGQEPWEDYHWLSGLDGIAFGCIAGWFAARTTLEPRTLSALAAIGLALMLLVTVLRSVTFDIGLSGRGLNVTVLELGTALLLVSLARRVGAWRATPGTGWIRLAGRCSYEIYLTHMFIVLPLVRVFRRVFPDGPPGRWMYPLAYLLALTSAVLLGCLVSRFFSEPANRWLRGRALSRTNSGAVAL